MEEIVAMPAQAVTPPSESNPPAEISATADSQNSQADWGLNDESLRRVQACLIACEGITTEDLESGIIQEMRQTLKDVVPLLQSLRRNCA